MLWAPVSIMAHEIGHVRQRHLIWLIVAAAGLLVLLELLMRGSLHAIVAGPLLKIWQVTRINVTVLCE